MTEGDPAATRQSNQKRGSGRKSRKFRHSGILRVLVGKMFYYVGFSNEDDFLGDVRGQVRNSFQVS
jgi:hypothetical protein